MTRKWWVHVFVIPNLRSLAAWLRHKDENSVGLDDATADATDRYINELETYLASE